MLRHFFTKLLIGLLFAVVFSSCISSRNQTLFNKHEGDHSIGVKSHIVEFEVHDSPSRAVIKADCTNSDSLYGYMDVTGTLIVPRCFSRAEKFSNGVALVTLKDLSRQDYTGFINRNSQFIFPPTITNELLVDISPATGRLVDGYSFLEERFPLKIAENGKIGFIDKTGNFVIPPQFDSVGGFHSGFSVVCQTTEAQTQINQPEELCGYIDRDGEWALAPKLKLATLFIDDVAVVQFPEQLYEFSIINNKSFQPLVDAPIDTVGNYYAGHPGYTPPPQVQKGYDYPGHSLKDSWNVSSGLLQVRVSGCEDKSRTGASPLNEQTLKYEYWNPGSGTYGFVDVEEGGFAIEPQFCHGVQGIGDFFEDRAFVSTDFTNTLPSHLERWRGHTVMIDPQGNIIDTDNSDVLPDYTRRGDRFHEGLCSVSALSEVSPNLKRRGYVDRDGEWVIQPQFKEASSFSEGLAAVQDPKTMKYGFIDKRGEYVIPPQFENAKDFLYGLAPIQETDDGEWGYINARGKVVIEPSFYEAEVFWSQNLAEVKSEGVTNFIDKKGKYILPPLKSVITTPLNEDLISVSYLEPSESNRRVSLLVNASGSILPYRPFNPRRTYHHDDILSLEKSDGLIRAGRDLPASQFRN